MFLYIYGSGVYHFETKKFNSSSFSVFEILRVYKPESFDMRNSIDCWQMKRKLIFFIYIKQCRILSAIAWFEGLLEKLLRACQKNHFLTKMTHRFTEFRSLISVCLKLVIFDIHFGSLRYGTIWNIVLDVIENCCFCENFIQYVT